VHCEKQTEMKSFVEALVGKKTVGQKSQEEKEKLPVGITYVAVMVGEKGHSRRNPYHR
jgi:hypothetical protein